MAINKEKNVTLQVTFPKKLAEDLEKLKTAFNNEGIRVSKSDILVRAFKDYLTIVLVSGSSPETQEETKEEEVKC
ncbi:MAG: hypothetical protein J6S67_13040 [Methanobrevibacter sp.]|nr:hypothetical protein [Methanobrevibacter sp.]